MKNKSTSGNKAATPNTQSTSPCEQSASRVKHSGKPPVQMVFDQMLPEWPEGSVPEPLVTKSELAAHYRVSTRTVERWVAADIPRQYVGKREMRFRVSEAQVWLQQNRLNRFATHGTATTIAEVRRRIVNIPILSGLEIVAKSTTPKGASSVAPGNVMRPNTEDNSALKAQRPNVLTPKCKPGRKSAKPERYPANPCATKKHRWKVSRYTRTCAVCGRTEERDPLDNWIEST